MEQIRAALAWLKRQHFWVLMGLAPLIAIACWYSATGALTSKFTANKSAIDGEFTATSSIQSQAFKPNDAVNTLQKNETKKLADGVLALWTSLYDRQKEQVLRWPAQLSERFKNYVANKKFGDNIQDALRNEYMTYIDRRFPELVDIVKAVPIPDEGDAAPAGGGRGAMMGEMMMGGGGRGGPMGGGRGGMMGGEMGGMAAMGGAEEIELPAGKIVDWLADDQARLKAELQPPQVPSPLAIWVTQENLWVYETILRAIANTNEAAGADRNGNAAVRKIYSMLVGNMAKGQGTQSGQRIYMPEVAAVGGMEGEGGMMEGGAEMMEGGDMMGGERGMMEGEMGMGGEGDETQMLLAGRYLDAEGKPLPVAGGGGDAAADPMADPAASGGGFDFGVEYKRLPVSLTLQVDQRWLSRLIVELANAPLQIEIQEVRVDPKEEMGGGMMGGRGGGGMGMMPGLGGGAAEIQFFDRQPHVKNVILQGIVYIFNPPDETLLNVDEEGAEGEASADGALEPGV